MKRLIVAFCITCVVLVFAACAEGNETVTETPTPAEMPTEVPDVTPAKIETDVPTQTETTSHTPTPDSLETGLFEGKVGIISVPLDSYELEYYAARNVIEKYGEGKSHHLTLPQTPMFDMGAYRWIVSRFCEDKDVRAIIVQGGDSYLDEALIERGDDLSNIFIPYICVGGAGGDFADITKQVDIVLRTDEVAMGISMVHQAQKLGAKTFIHYSIPRHMDQPTLYKRRELIKEECAKLGMGFVDVTAPDSQSEIGVTGVQQFTIENATKMITKYGKDTAFFSTACVMQEPLIKTVIDGGAIYPSPCHPSPYHGFTRAFDLGYGEDGTLTPNAEKRVAKIKEILAEKNMLGRLSTWPVDPNMMCTEASAEYVVKWINGEVPKEGIDIDVLTQLMTDYAGVQVYLTPYMDEYLYTNYLTGETREPSGETYENYLLVRMDYITY